MYQITITHEGLNRVRVIKGATFEEVEAKAESQQSIWESIYQRQVEADERKRARALFAAEKEREANLKAEQVQLAAELTREAERAIAEAQEILTAALCEGPTFTWDSLKDLTSFNRPEPKPPSKPSIPEKPDPSWVPTKPDKEEARFQPRIGFWESLLPGRTQRAIEQAQSRFDTAVAEWNEAVKRYNDRVKRHNHMLMELKELYRRDKHTYKTSLAAWHAQRDEFESRRAAQHQAVDQKRISYRNRDMEAVLDFCENVLLNSKHPEFCFRLFDCAYEPSTGALIVDYRLPSIDDIPYKKSAKYDRTQNKIVYANLAQSALSKLYEDINYQIVLRTLHELFRADDAKTLDSIVFNGFVDTIDKATGQAVKPCIMSIQVSRLEFEPIRLDQVDPKACFKKLKGVSAAKLQALAPVAPVAQINREDKRFVESYTVAGDLDDSVNLASMDWEDFEHLIRELFAREFEKAGGEVKVTQASRDGGVDAVAFDPDPIRGGKIVIQAKRYTNVVGVSAVRDLFGTVMNEGAIKGILVTTSHYGADAYEFAKGKPLTLLDGGNLLHLLARHGHKAKIDLREAKKELSSRTSEAS
jgi:restriction system protein